MRRRGDAGTSGERIDTSASSRFKEMIADYERRGDASRHENDHGEHDGKRRGSFKEHMGGQFAKRLVMRSGKKT
jgi:hypothetical protein